MTINTHAHLVSGLKEQFGLDTVALRYGLNQDELFLAAIENDRVASITMEGPTSRKPSRQHLARTDLLSILQILHAQGDR